ncbi:MAG: thaumatin family protein [Deltaproteobacteria bacterium]|nr:thaumatin family protein [Deltaproteobacteria bacterium]
MFHAVSDKGWWRFFPCFLFFVVFLWGGSAFSSWDSDAVPTQGSEEPIWLYVIRADKATLADADTLLVLEGITPDILAFTDRPYREHRIINWDEFMALWGERDGSFSHVPPNVILTGVAADPSGIHCGMEMEFLGVPDLYAAYDKWIKVPVHSWADGLGYPMVGAEIPIELLYEGVDPWSCRSMEGVSGFVDGIKDTPVPATVTVHNQSGATVTVYMLFNKESCYQPQSQGLAFCVPDAANSNLCSFDLDHGANQPILFSDPTCEGSTDPHGRKASFNVAADKPPSTGCQVNQAELTLHDDWGQYGGWQDTYNMSLVNGFNMPMSIVPSSGAVIKVTAETGNQAKKGVYPKGCDVCNQQSSGSPCPGPPVECKTDGGKYPCQLSQASGADFTVNILKAGQ